jgi:chromosome segregation ATPase
LLVSLLVETTIVEQTQILKHGREKVESPAGGLPLTQPSDAPQGKVAQAPQSAPAAARERKQVLEREWFARALTSSLRGELDEVRSAADAEIKQNQALDQERARADVLARELTSLRAELDAARIAGTEVTQAAEAEIKQKQALELERNQQRDRADALARELSSLRAELETARAVGLETAQTTATAKIEQEQAFGKEREKIETLARELAAAREEAEARSALLAAAHAEASQVTATNTNTAEHECALASERDRADALARELASARNELRQIAASNSLRALHSRASAVDRSQKRMAKSYSRAIEGQGRSAEQISGKAAAFTSRP